MYVCVHMYAHDGNRMPCATHHNSKHYLACVHIHQACICEYANYIKMHAPSPKVMITNTHACISAYLLSSSNITRRGMPQHVLLTYATDAFKDSMVRLAASSVEVGGEYVRIHTYIHTCMHACMHVQMHSKVL
jgi:hypothetical protein